MILRSIKKENIIKSIEEIEKFGVPKSRRPKKYLLEFNGKYYPPKYIISLANKYANGRELDFSRFSGGEEANRFLRNLGFNIISIEGGGQDKTIKSYRKQREKELLNIHHNGRCPKCKETIKSS